MSKKRLFHILLGPALFFAGTALFQSFFTQQAAKALGISLWMIVWWMARPVHITVTAMVPVIANAFFNVVPMNGLLAQYASESIILIFGSGLLTAPWSSIGLDKRISLKALTLIGPSMRSQITVWLLASIVLSNLMPNVVVVAILTPIAIAMLNSAGYEAQSEAAVPILCAIGWGAGIGGVGTPLGGAMNITAIALLQDFTGTEYMYIQWMIHLLPYTLLVSAACLGVMLLRPGRVRTLQGSREYFQQQYKALGPVKREEILCLLLFLAGLVAVFLRPLYAEQFPRLVPAYVFLLLGFCCFFLTSSERKEPLVTWEMAQKETMWGMMILFAGGLAMGHLLSVSGANAQLAERISSWNLAPGLPAVLAITLVACFFSETTNSTVSAAVTIPIVLHLSTRLHWDLMTYWYIAVMALNAEFLLPVSVRCIPVTYGLDPQEMLKRGIPVFLVRILVVILVSMVCLHIPGFGN